MPDEAVIVNSINEFFRYINGIEEDLDELKNFILCFAEDLGLGDKVDASTGV